MSERVVQPTIPEPYQDVKSLRATAMALKEAVEILLGQRGDGTEAALTMNDVLNKALEGYVSDYFAKNNYAPIPVIKNWTPLLQFSSANVGMTYGARSGRSLKIGRSVTIWWDIQLSAKGTSVGNAAITNIPYPGVGGILFAGKHGYTTAMAAGKAMLGGYVNGSVYTITSLNLAANETALNTASDADFTNTSRIIGTCTYETSVA